MILQTDAYNRVNIAKLVGGGYGAFWRFKGRNRVCKGSRASKKSKTTALWYIYHMMKLPGANLLVIRKTERTLKTSCFTELKWAVHRLQVDHLWNFTVSPLEATYLPTGQKIYFRGLDDPLKITSITVDQGSLCWMWIEEAYEIMKEDDFNMLNESIRGEVGEGLFKQITITFNPWNEKHWLKSRFFDKKANDTKCYSTNYLINEFLDKTDIAIFEKLKKEHPSMYKVAGLGEWGISEGLIYENWKVGTKETKSDQWQNFFGLDYGYSSDPTAFIAFSVNRKTKEIYIFDEIYKSKMLNSDIAKEIIEKGYAKERIRADSAEPKSNDDLKRLGIRRIMPSVKGKDSVINGIMNISEYQITVNQKYKNTVSELSSYMWEKGEKNIPQDKNNHLMDALRYAFYDVKSTDKSEVKKYTSQINGGWDI